MSVIGQAVIEASVREVLDDHGNWPWNLIGVFPTEDEPNLDDWFVYTVGLTPLVDMWLPCKSIEGKMMEIDATAMFLNHLAAGFLRSAYNYGDEIFMPLGVPDGEDVMGIFVVGWPEPKDGSGNVYQANVSDAVLIVPVSWSSPLGKTNEAS